MPIRLIYDHANNGFHHHHGPQKNDLFKQVTKSFNFWVHKFNWKKDSKALMVGAAALAGLVVAAGLAGAGIASLFSKKEGQIKQQNPKDKSFKMNVPKQVSGENGVERSERMIDLKIIDTNLDGFKAKLQSLIEDLNPDKIVLVGSDKKEKLIHLSSEKRKEYIKLDSLEKEVEKSRKWINEERAKTNNETNIQYQDDLTNCSNKLEQLEELIQKMKNPKLEQD